MHVEANPTNRRALLVLEPRSPSSGGLGNCGLVLIGSLALDSVRLEPEVEVGAEVAQWQRLGCFAGGGSVAVLCFFGAPVELVEACAEVHAEAMPFQLDCCASLARPCGSSGSGGGSGGADRSGRGGGGGGGDGDQ